MSRYYLGNMHFKEEDKDLLIENSSKHFSRINVGMEYSVTYGYDHAVGVFVQLEPDTGNDISDDYDSGNIIDLDALFSELRASDLAYFLEMTHGSPKHIIACRQNGAF